MVVGEDHMRDRFGEGLCMPRVWDREHRPSSVKLKPVVIVFGNYGAAEP